MFMFGSVSLMFASMFILAIVYLIKRNDIEIPNRNNIKINRKQNIQSTKCYENGEITNLCTIIALKNIKREISTILSDIEKDAIDKAVDNTIRVEKLKAFIDNVELEDIDIDE